MTTNNFPKIIAISGPQGCGKGTLINTVMDIDFDRGLLKFFMDTFKVSRSVQKELGYETLAAATDTLEKMIHFQNTILDHKEKSLKELMLCVGSDFILTERSFIDIAAYFELWLKKQNIDLDQNFIKDYFNRCYALQREICNYLVVIPMMEHIQPEIDPNRADYSDVDEFYSIFMKHLEKSGVQARFITKESAHARAEEFISFFGE